MFGVHAENDKAKKDEEGGNGDGSNEEGCACSTKGFP
jgi:hypothetical protein